MTAHRERLAPNLALAALCFAAFGYWWGQAQDAVATQNFQWAQDLAFFHQIFHAAVNGSEWTSPLLLEPQGFFEMVHFHPIFGALVPLYALRPAVDTLLAFNIAAVISAAIPLALLARSCSSRRWFGVAAAAAWLMWPPVGAAALADFRPLHFMLPGWMTVALGVHTRKRLPLILGAVLCMLAREEAAYLLFATGLVFCVLPYGQTNRRAEGLWLLGLGAFWFAVLLTIKGNLFFHFDPLNWFSGEGPSPENALTHARLTHLVGLIAGGFAAAIFAPALLAAALPVSIWLLFDPYREWHTLNGNYVHYRAVLLPWLASAGVVGLCAVLNRYSTRFGPRLWAIGVFILVAGNTLSLPYARAQFHAEVVDFNKAQNASTESQNLARLIEKLSPDDAVVTDYRLVASVSGRDVVWASAQLYSHEAAPWHWTANWPLTWSVVDTALLLDNDPLLERVPEDWAKVEEAAGYGLWRRQANPSQSPAHTNSSQVCPPGMVHIPGGRYTTGMRPPFPYGVVETEGQAQVEAPESQCPAALKANPDASACWVQTDLHDPIVGLHEVEVDGFCIETYPFPGRDGQYPSDGLTTWDAMLFDDMLSTQQFGERRLCTFTEYELAVAGPTANHRFVFGDEYDASHCPQGERSTIGSQSACQNPETGVFEYGAVHSQWVLLDEALVAWACSTDENCAASGGRRLDERTESGELAIRYIVAGGTNRSQTRQAPYTPHTFHDHGDATGPDGCDSWGWDDQIAVCASPSEIRARCNTDPTGEDCAAQSDTDDAWRRLRDDCAASSMTECLNRGLRPIRGNNFDACPDRSGAEGPGQGR